MNVIEFNKLMRLDNVILGEIELEVGRHYLLCDRYVRFIKVTRKGFNFLDEKTSRCLLHRHVYAKGYGGKEIPHNECRFVFRINANLIIEKIG